MDCGDKTCDVEYHLVANCLLYTDISEGRRCEYPCSTNNCRTEIHQFMLCPTWSCTSKTTTTTPSPTLSPTLPTLSPWPTSSSNCSSTICVPSLVFNGLFGVILLALVALYVLYRRRNRRLTTFFNSQTNPLFEAEAGFDYFQNQRPIIRNQPRRTSSSEREPLIFTRRASNPGSNPGSADGRSICPLPSPAPAVLALNPNIQETQF